jgi:hypothetical protein
MTSKSRISNRPNLVNPELERRVGSALDKNKDSVFNNVKDNVGSFYNGYISGNGLTIFFVILVIIFLMYRYRMIRNERVNKQLSGKQEEKTRFTEEDIYDMLKKQEIKAKMEQEQKKLGHMFVNKKMTDFGMNPSIIAPQQSWASSYGVNPNVIQQKPVQPQNQYKPSYQPQMSFQPQYQPSIHNFQQMTSYQPNPMQFGYPRQLPGQAQVTYAKKTPQYPRIYL